jgi:hypothetical protein
MAKKKSKEGEDAAAYAKVKELMLSRIRRYTPTGDLSKSRFKLACSGREMGQYWFLLSDTESDMLLFLKGEAVGIDGCVDDLNVFPHSSPLVTMLTTLDIITKDEAEGFRREARAIRSKDHVATKLSMLEREAAVLGYTLIPKPQTAVV